MRKALMWKELRETLGIVALAALTYFVVVTSNAGFRLYPWSSPLYSGFPFMDGEFIVPFALSSAIFAALLGFRQTLGESYRDTWLFYLHRPVNLRCLLGVKLATGLALYFSIAAAAILAYAVWAATPGNHANPFAWWMTGLAWKTWLTASLLYLGAFLSGIRPGHWFGTRLMPLLAVSLPVLVMMLIPWWPLSGLLLWMFFAALFMGEIFHVAKSRDYS
jgi:hypothetical protein